MEDLHPRFGQQASSPSPQKVFPVSDQFRMEIKPAKDVPVKQEPTANLPKIDQVLSLTHAREKLLLKDDESVTSSVTAKSV